MPVLEGTHRGKSRAVQWLGLCASTAGARGSIPGVPSLRGELRSCKLSSAATPKKIKRKESTCRDGPGSRNTPL